MSPEETPTATGNITTPLDALCAIQVALRLTYGDEGPRIWRLSGVRGPADWRPATAREVQP